jgi:hypothetical protein
MKSSIEYKSRGALVGRTMQRWVKATGRRVVLEECPWLEGPVGDVDVIGGDLKTSVSTSIHEATFAPITISRSGARHFSGYTIKSHRNPEAVVCGKTDPTAHRSQISQRFRSSAIVLLTESLETL